MVLEEIKGFNSLTKEQQALFIRVHGKHMATLEDKEGWQPVRVKWEKTCLKVTFKNGEWLHYTRSGEWY